ncbi:MAG: hypothetical protein A2X48_01895 [Lentisphaerae bacterium GWF2_49_21]|nr:MAG: hypothetical protein A2X48_01895 [Lentisphaerae bacterium GWF2_49_21]
MAFYCDAPWPDEKTACGGGINQSFIAEAPVVLVCCAKTDGRIMACSEPCYPIDVAIAIDQIALVATELGLGT